MNAAQVEAFKAAAGGISGGYSPEMIAVVLGGVVATIALVWAAYAFFRLGSEAQEADPSDSPNAITKALIYKLRLFVLLAIVLYIVLQ